MEENLSESGVNAGNQKDNILEAIPDDNELKKTDDVDKDKVVENNENVSIDDDIDNKKKQIDD